MNTHHPSPITHHPDSDIRAALSQRHVHEPQLPADFAERLAQRLAQLSTEPAAQPADSNADSKPAAPKRGKWWRKVAATFLGLLLISGIAIAAVRLLSRPSQPAVSSLVGGDSIAAVQEVEAAPADSLVNFDDQPLDQLLNVVATHYAHAVAFASDSLRQLRITTTWNSREPLAAFLESLNELDGLHLTAQGDTIYVETKAEEDAR